MCIDCPQHGFNNRILIQIFYGGLGLKDRVLVDSFSRTPILKKTPKNAYYAFEELSRRTEFSTSKEEQEANKQGVQPQGEKQKMEAKEPKEDAQGNDRANPAGQYPAMARPSSHMARTGPAIP